MATPAPWITLKCECGGEAFVKLVRLRYKPDGGTTEEAAGHYCVACEATVDNAYMIRLVQTSLKRLEVQRLQQELAEEPNIKASARTSVP